MYGLNLIAVRSENHSQPFIASFIDSLHSQRESFFQPLACATQLIIEVNFHNISYLNSFVYLFIYFIVVNLTEIISFYPKSSMPAPSNSYSPNFMSIFY